MKRIVLLVGGTILVAGCATRPAAPAMQICADGSQVAVTEPCPPPPPPPPTACPDGSVVAAGMSCLPPPPPPPPPPSVRRSGERG